MCAVCYVCTHNTHGGVCVCVGGGGCECIECRIHSIMVKARNATSIEGAHEARISYDGPSIGLRDMFK